MKRPSIRWLVSLPASMVYSMAAAGLCQFSGSRGGAASLGAALAPPLLASSVALWVLADARRRRFPLPYDFGSFVFFGYAAVAPIYLFRTRGWRAFGALAWFFLLCLTAALLASIPLIFAG